MPRRLPSALNSKSICLTAHARFLKQKHLNRGFKISMTTIAAEKLATALPKKEDKPEKRKALGRGLESLLPGPRVVPSHADPHTPRPDLPSNAITAPARFAANSDSGAAPPVAAQASSQVIVNLGIDSIDKNPYQTRYLFDEQEMIELRDSIREHGVVQPVVVRPADEDGRYILVLGERRLRASKMAEKDTVPALVRRLSPQQAAEMTVLENVVREDLNPIEQAEAYRVLSQEFNLTQAQIAQRIGVSRESVANYMRLLRLPEQLKQHVALGRLGFSEARELLSLQNPEHILIVAEELLQGTLKWDDLKDRIACLNGSLPSLATASQPQATGARWVDPNVRAAQMEMERLLGVRVKIKDRNGKGKIVIEYRSVEDYERVIEALRGKNS
jgi:ParB family transcriptional regulator, chromosome partitioning protein